MHRDDHRLRIAVHRAEGGVVAGVDLNDPLRMRRQLLDIDARAKAAPGAAQHDHVHAVVAAERVDRLGERLPAARVQRIDRRLLDHQLADAAFAFDTERQRADAIDGFCHGLRPW